MTGRVHGMAFEAAHADYIAVPQQAIELGAVAAKSRTGAEYIAEGVLHY